MATATRTRSNNVLTELSALEVAHQHAADQASTLSREHWQKVCKLNGTPGRDDVGLLDQLRRLHAREPDQFTHDGSPVDENSDAGRLIREIKEINGGLEDLGQRVEHARRIEARRAQDLDAYIQTHLPEIAQAKRAHLEGLARNANEAAATLAAALDAYLDGHRGMAGYCTKASRPGDATLVRSIPGLEAAANFKAVAESVDLPPTIPAVQP